jgi:myxalamid-type polyketide synthase MxaB
VSLNFRDVLNILGMYPGDPGSPGCEYAGVVTRVGSQVTGFQAGDSVVGIGSGCLKELICESHQMMRRKPESLTMCEAATIPIVYCTVALALGELAALTAGEIVLIHAAAGGVGLAAIQYAQRVGARIIATASEGKRDYLRSLGVELICTSRDAEQFKAELASLVEQYGPVSVVLNSLSGDYIPYSLDSLVQGGRFLEIGKRGIWSAAEVADRRPDVAYSVIGLDDLAAQRPDELNRILADVCSSTAGSGSLNLFISSTS